MCMFCVCSVQRDGRDEMRQHWSLYSHVVRLRWTRYMWRLDGRNQLQSVYFLSAYLYNPQSLKVYLQHMNWTEGQFGTRVRELLRNISALALRMCPHMYELSWTFLSCGFSIKYIHSFIHSRSIIVKVLYSQTLTVTITLTQTLILTLTPTLNPNLRQDSLWL